MVLQIIQIPEAQVRKNFLYVMRCFKAVQGLCQAKGKEGGRLSHFMFTDKEEQTAVIPKGL